MFQKQLTTTKDEMMYFKLSLMGFAVGNMFSIIFLEVTPNIISILGFMCLLMAFILQFKDMIKQIP